MKKIVIISSFREACGPAAHTVYLKKALESVGIEVEVAKINVSLMRNTSKSAKPLIRQEIKRIINLANEAQGVILQLEPGLYGPAPWISYSRINKIIDGIKVKTLPVLHGWDRPSKVFDNLLGLIKDVINPFSLGLKRYYFSRLMLRIHPSYGRFIKRLSKIGVICFSRADITELEFYSGNNNYYVPISYLLEKDIKRVVSNSQVFRKNICNRLGFDQNQKIIIAPGFINSYKNTIATLDSLQYLPDNYHLIIAGGLHPHASQLNISLFELLQAKSGSKVPHPSFMKLSKNDHVTQLSEYSKQTRDRIHFVGSVDDDELNDWIAAADYVVLPYLNTPTGQSGSGPFALAVEIGKQSFFGSAGVFQAQDFVSSTSPFTFDSTNSAELAYRLKNAEKDKVHYDSFIEKFRKKYNAESQVNAYLKLLDLDDG